MFRGFPPGAIAFYEGLAADNTKAYFDAHRDQYETCVREPLEDLVLELSADFGTAKVFRPNRDVRFAKDKSPYKLAAAAVARRDDATCSATYVQLGADGLMVGGGLYELDRGQLERARRAIDDPRHGTELEEVAHELEHGHGLALTAPELKVAPRGFPKDHPRIDLLRRKRLAAIRRHPPAAWLHTPQAKDRVVEAWQAVAPLNAWLERHVGPPDPVERRR